MLYATQERIAHSGDFNGRIMFLNEPYLVQKYNIDFMTGLAIVTGFVLLSIVICSTWLPIYVVVDF